MGVLEEWSAVSTAEFGMLAVAAVVVLAGYVFIVIAMRVGDTAVVTPFRYTYMVFALVSSVLVFRQSPDTASWVGVTLVVGSGLYMLHRERVVGQRLAARREGEARAA